jgi:hypothetical protein
MKRLGSIDPTLFWKLFDTQIEPILSYASEVWGLDSKATNQIEKIHTFSIKRFLNLPLHSSNKMLYGETGRYPLYIRTAIKCVKYWLRITKLPKTRISKQTYEMLFTQNEIGKNNWVSKIQNILTKNGFGIVWLCQGVGYENNFLSVFKDRLISSYKQNWHSEIETNEKYKWYYSFKNAFDAEKYLTFITTKKFRDTLVRFRLRACGLRSHKVWFFAEPDVSNNCPLCGFEQEDEIHVLFHCHAYEKFRSRFPFTKQCSMIDDLTRMQNTLKNEDEAKITALSKFLTVSLNYRQKAIESGQEVKTN